YKFRDVAIEELQKVHRVNPGFKPLVDTYTFSDSSQKDLLKLVGNIPVSYQGRSYNLPILLWLLDSFPFTPPICLLRPTPSMMIRVGKHVDARGRIYLPYLHNWDHPASSVNGLLSEMIAKFEEEPPLCTKPSADEKDPAELLAYVEKISGGMSTMNIGPPANVGRVYPERPLNKVTVVGGGDLGVACLMSILAKGSVDKIVLIDFSEHLSKGGTMDLEIFSLPKVEIARDLSASADSKVVVVTSNAWSDDESFVSVVQTNVDLYQGIIPGLARCSPSGVLLIASQPVDIMTHVAWKQSGLPPSRVIGTGCNLDSERLNYIVSTVLLSRAAGSQPWVVGELSDNKVPAWSSSAPATDSQPEITPGPTSTKPLTDRAFEILKGRGQRSLSVGLSVADIVHSILADQRKMHSVSTLAQGWGGVCGEVFLSLPCELGTGGVARILKLTLGQEEDLKLRNSATSLKNFIQQLRI
ncbi:UEVLD enzyme, partial [Atractosteus spatula]|nr:UEVLD enzyme [Atractosteus spatula]